MCDSTKMQLMTRHYLLVVSVMASTLTFISKTMTKHEKTREVWRVQIAKQGYLNSLPPEKWICTQGRKLFMPDASIRVLIHSFHSPPHPVPPAILLSWRYTPYLSSWISPRTPSGASPRICDSPPAYLSSRGCIRRSAFPVRGSAIQLPCQPSLSIYIYTSRWERERGSDMWDFFV